MNIIILSFAIYAIYNIVSIYKNKGIPNSLSTTYYIWPKWVFPLVSLAISWTLMPGLVGLTHGSLFFFLPFLVFIGLTFIGIFPNYKKDATHYKVHSSLAYAMAFISIFFIICICHKYILLLDIGIKVFLINFIVDRHQLKTNWLYWLETTLFLTTYIGLLI